MDAVTHCSCCIAASVKCAARRPGSHSLLSACFTLTIDCMLRFRLRSPQIFSQLSAWCSLAWAPTDRPCAS